MPERDIRNIIPSGIISLIDRHRDRNPVREELLNRAPEENITQDIVDIFPDGFVESPDNSMALPEAEVALEETVLFSEDREISRKIREMYIEEFPQGRQRSVNMSLAEEFMYMEECHCPGCEARRQEAMRVHKEREKERENGAQEGTLSKKSRKKLINKLREEIGDNRIDCLESAQSGEKLWEYLGTRGAESETYFMALMAYMPDEVFNRMTQLPSEDEIAPMIQYLLASINTLGKMDSPELKFGRLIERAYGSVAVDRLAGTAGLTAYAFARKNGFEDGDVLSLTRDNEAELKEQITSLQQGHQERMGRIEPLNALFTEPLRYGIEVECNAHLVPLSERRLIEIKAVLGIAGWRAGTDINGSYEYKSNPVEDVELLGVELELLAELGYLPFDRTRTSGDGMHLAHGVHLTTSGVSPKLERRWGYTPYKPDVHLLQHTDEASGFMSAFDFVGINLKRQEAMVKGEITERSSGALVNNNTTGWEQRTLVMYDIENFMNGVRTHARKVQALAAYEALPARTREALSDQEYSSLLTRRGNRSVAQIMAHGRNWIDYEAKVYSSIDRAVAEADSDPRLLALASEWVKYKAFTKALFAVSSLPDPELRWDDYMDNDEDIDVHTQARPALYNMINRVFKTSEGYYTDPADIPMTVKVNGRERETEINLRGRHRFSNFVHGLRYFDNALVRKVERVLDSNEDSDL